MKRFILVLFLSVVLCSPVMYASDIWLSLWGFNFNGVVQADYSPNLPGSEPADWGANYSGFDFGDTGMGTINFTFAGGPGPYYFIVFLDHEIGPFPLDSNTGTAFGSLPTNEFWQIGPPGYPDDGGDTFQMFQANTLKNTNEIEGGEYADVSAALGWNFSLNPGDVANFNIRVSPNAPSSGFYLQEFDAVTGKTIYFSNDLRITPGGEPTPEPASIILLGSGVVLVLRKFGTRRAS